MSAGERAAAPHAVERAGLLDDASGKRDIPHEPENDSWNDEKDQAEQDPKCQCQGEPDDRPKPPKSSAEGFADRKGSAAHVLECTINNNGLAEDAEDKPQQC